MYKYIYIYICIHLYTELDREGMNKVFEDHIHRAQCAKYEVWEQTYSEHMNTLQGKEQTKKQHWISEETWKLIQEQADEEWWWTEEE